MTITIGTNSPEVKKLQETILKLNPRALPRWGADSSLGDETMHAVAVLLNDEAIEEDAALDDKEIARVYALLSPSINLPTLPANYVDLRSVASKEERRSKRAWSKVTAIVWHQTDCDVSNEEHRYLGTPVHYVVTRDGRILHLHDEDWLTWGGHSTNSFGVHVEIEGRLLGVEGNPNTYRKYHTDAGLPAQQLPQVQINAAIALAKFIADRVAAFGGKLLYSVAHRQGTNVRDPDPGSAIWQLIVLVVEQLYGIKTLWDKVWGKGKQIPKEWDPRSTAKY